MYSGHHFYLLVAFLCISSRTWNWVEKSKINVVGFFLLRNYFSSDENSVCVWFIQMKKDQEQSGEGDRTDGLTDQVRWASAQSLDVRALNSTWSQPRAVVWAVPVSVRV